MKKKKKTGAKPPAATGDLKSLVEKRLRGSEGMTVEDLQEATGKDLGAKPGQDAIAGVLMALGLLEENEAHEEKVFRLAAEEKTETGAPERTPAQQALEAALLGAVRAAWREDVESVEEQALMVAVRDVKPRPSGADFAASLEHLVASGKLWDLDGAYALPPASDTAVEKARAIAADPKRSRTTLYLRHELTDAERLDAKARAASTLLEADELRDGELAEARSRAAKLKSELEEAQKEVKALEGREEGLVTSARTMAQSERKGFDHRNVQCITLADWKSGYEIVFRLDGPDPVEVKAHRKPLTGTRRTGDLFDGAPEAEA